MNVHAMDMAHANRLVPNASCAVLLLSKEGVVPTLHRADGWLFTHTADAADTDVQAMARLRAWQQGAAANDCEDLIVTGDDLAAVRTFATVLAEAVNVRPQLWGIARSAAAEAAPVVAEAPAMAELSDTPEADASATERLSEDWLRSGG